MRTSSIFLCLVICSSLGFGSYLLGCGNDDDEDVVGCLADCVHQQANKMKICVIEEKGCLLNCSGFDDSTCMRSCYETYDQCESNQHEYDNNCLSQCPCIGDCPGKCGNDSNCVNNCIEECPGVREITDKYVSCNRTCNDTKNVCLSGCDQFNLVDWQQWVECEKGCVISAWGCGYNCI
jgi:hypothetical protein